MKIILTGGGSGGHFYPIIAIVDALHALIEQEKLVNVELIYMSDDPYNKRLLASKGMVFIKVQTGKIRRYFSIKNISDTFKTFTGITKAIGSIYSNFPDVIFSKGGYAAFPAVVASRFFGIPLIIHESDAIPGKVNRFSGKFAKKIAISYPSALKYFPEKKTALTGNPIRREFFTLAKTGAKEFFDFNDKLPILFITGGSQGAEKINNTIVDILPQLVEKYQVIHQAGKATIEEVKQRSLTSLENSPNKHNYKLFDYLNKDGMRMAFGAADLVISRSGSGIFEIAASGLPSITIPLKNSAQNHQRANAYDYSKIGATDVIEESNLTPHVLLSEIGILINDKERLKAMGEAAKKFSRPDAAEKIAREILNLALAHA